MTSNSQPEEPRAAVAPPPLSATPVLDPERAAIVAARDSMHLDDGTREISDMMLGIAQPLRGRGLSLQALMAHGCVGLIAASESFRHQDSDGCFARYAAPIIERAMRHALANQPPAAAEPRLD